MEGLKLLGSPLDAQTFQEHRWTGVGGSPESADVRLLGEELVVQALLQRGPLGGAVILLDQTQLWEELTGEAKLRCACRCTLAACEYLSLSYCPPIRSTSSMQ